MSTFDRHDKFRNWMLVGTLISMFADQRYIAIGLLVAFFISMMITLIMMIKGLRK